MSNMNVTYQDMTDTATQLRAGQHDLESKLTELGNRIDALTSAGFVTDQASHAYNDQFHQFQNGTQQAISALDQLAGFLEQAANALQDTDTQLSQSISGS